MAGGIDKGLAKARDLAGSERGNRGLQDGRLKGRSRLPNGAGGPHRDLSGRPRSSPPGRATVSWRACWPRCRRAGTSATPCCADRPALQSSSPGPAAPRRCPTPNNSRPSSHPIPARPMSEPQTSKGPAMHIAPYDNQNKPIVDVDNACVPLNYFNIVKLSRARRSSTRCPATRPASCPPPAPSMSESEGVDLRQARPSRGRCLGRRAGGRLCAGRREGDDRLRVRPDRDLHRRRQIRQGARALRRARRRA
jgi:hypothetical protein